MTKLSFLRLPWTAEPIFVGDVRSIPNMKVSFKILRVYNGYFTYGHLFM